MKFRAALAAFFLFVFCSVLAGSASAQGVIIPIPCDRRPCIPRPRPLPQPMPSALPVKSINLDTKIEGQVATTHVVQVFRNDTRYTLEGTYFFPIPETASIIEFSIWENGKTLTGEVRTREEARRIYDEIVRRQRDPGLLEYAGKNLFQATIFPIPPNSDKKIELKYSQILKADSGVVAYHYPLGTGRNIWRRSAAETNVRPPRDQKFGTVSGSIEIVQKGEIRNIYSPSHEIEIGKNSGGRASVSFETANNDSDLRLYFGVSGNDIGMSLLTYREPGKDGYFLMMLSPNDDLAEKELVNKDIVFVLDTSGSMADEGKMEKARAALLFGIRTLRDGDRFNVINFAGEEHLMEAALINADADGKRRGEEFVKTLRPTGGTNINDSLIASVKQFDESDRPKMLVFMTDGLPTVGETNAEKIIANLQAKKKADVRIFPFGFGYDVNTALLDKLGAENSGVSDYIQPKEDLEVKVSNFFSRVSSPVLSGIELDFGGVRTDSMYPRKLHDIFKGMQLTIIGRYKNAEDLRNITVRMTGKAGNETKAYRYENLSFPMRSTENDFLPRLWASRRVGWLIEQIRLNGETKELKDEVIDLGTRYGIVTPYTSYLATDGSVANAQRGSAQFDMMERRSAPAKMAANSGAAAVRQSVQQNAMQSNATLMAAEDAEMDELIIVPDSVNNQFVANKNFFNKDGVWIDAEFSAEAKLPEKTIRFASDEYFELIRKEPEIAEYLAIGEEIVVVWKQNVYRITK